MKKRDLGKFDVVVGNPPYQKTTNPDSNNPQAVDLYHLFIDLAHKISKEYVVFITPSRWFSKSARKDLLHNMIYKYGLKYLWHTDDNKLFDGPDIKGGVSWFVLEKDFKGLAEINFLDKPIDLKKYPTILETRSILGSSLVQKLSTKNNISTIFYPKGFFGIKTNDSNAQEEAKQKDDIVCYFAQAKGLRKYIPLKRINNQEAMSKWKVIFRAADGSGRNYLNYYLIGKPGEIFNESYTGFMFDSEDEANNFVSYAMTNLFRYLTTIKKIKQDVTSEIFSLIPIVDFNQEWTNEKVYQYFNLTQEEIALIKSVVGGVE